MNGSGESMLISWFWWLNNGYVRETIYHLENTTLKYLVMGHCQQLDSPIIKNNSSMRAREWETYYAKIKDSGESEWRAYKKLFVLFLETP